MTGLPRQRCQNSISSIEGGLRGCLFGCRHEDVSRTRSTIFACEALMSAARLARVLADWPPCHVQAVESAATLARVPADWPPCHIQAIDFAARLTRVPAHRPPCHIQAVVSATRLARVAGAAERRICSVPGAVDACKGKGRAAGAFCCDMQLRFGLNNDQLFPWGHHPDPSSNRNCCVVVITCDHKCSDAAPAHTSHCGHTELSVTPKSSCKSGRQSYR